jgi:hypothetical protein
MANIVLKLKRNKDNKQELEIEYESNGDAMAWEHEEDHKALVEKLIGKKSLGDHGWVNVSRVPVNENTCETKEDALTQKSKNRN